MNKKVLLVDDEPNVLAALRRALGGRFTLHCASGGAEALALQETHGPFAAIVSDIRMPGMDGLELLREMRRRAPETVRLVLTGHADLNVVISAVNEGAIFRFHTKPVPAEVLGGSIERALLQHEIKKQTAYVVDSGDQLFREVGDLRRALAEDQLRMHVQPQICLADRRVTGVEALVRWVHPEMGLLLPGQFLHVAEAAGLLGDVTCWMLNAACAEVHRRQELGFDPVQIAVNVTATDIADAGFPLRVCGFLDRHRLAPQWLELELTESAAIAEMNSSRAALEDLGRLGIGLSIDDFGTGYSTFSRLRQLPFDKLKIDRLFVQEIDGDRDAYRILETMITLARDLGLTVVAEGVETAAQMELLAQAGCDLAQGFLFARPMPATAFDGWQAPRSGIKRSRGKDTVVPGASPRLQHGERTRARTKRCQGERI